MKTEKIALSKLKDLPIVDWEEQRELKDYIDDLVFAFYFRIPLQNLGLNFMEEIKSRCARNPHYELVKKKTQKS